MSQNQELMKEYELCQQGVQALEATIWQSGSLVGIGSVGGILLVAGLDDAQLAVIPAGIMVVFGNFLWWRLAKRWWSVQHARITRMRLIEQQLKRAGQASYVQYLNDLDRVRSRRKKRWNKRGERPQGLVARLRNRVPLEDAVELHRVNCPTYYKPGPREFLWQLPWINLVAWVVLSVLLIFSRSLPS